MFIQGGEFAVFDFPLDDAVGGDFRRAGEEEFIDGVPGLEVVDEAGFVQENADFAFDDHPRFLEGEEGLGVDDFVPNVRGVDVF